MRTPRSICDTQIFRPAKAGLRMTLGFTLVELLIVITLLGIVLTILYASFQTGLTAYSRAEGHLTERREGDIFLLQLEGELRNAIPYVHPNFQHHFVGKKNFLSFPARLRRYTPKGMSEELVLVRYEVKDRSLVRTVRKLRAGGLKEKGAERETLLEGLENFRFDFLYVNPSDQLVWQDDWPNHPYIGLPRGVRVTAAGNVFGREMQLVEILIPQGVLVRVPQ